MYQIHLVLEHKEAPHMRLLQKRLADEVTVTVHNEEALENAIKASNMLFGKSTSEDLKNLDTSTFLDVFEGVTQAEVSKSEIESGFPFSNFKFPHLLTPSLCFLRCLLFKNSRAPATRFAPNHFAPNHFA